MCGDRSEWRSVYKGARGHQEPLRDPKCSALGHLHRPAQSFPILSAPPLTGLSSGTHCPGHSLNLQAAWDNSLPRAPGLAVLPAFLLSLLCPCLSSGSLAYQALSTPGAELHPPQLLSWSWAQDQARSGCPTDNCYMDGQKPGWQMSASNFARVYEKWHLL